MEPVTQLDNILIRCTDGFSIGDGTVPTYDLQIRELVQPTFHVIKVPRIQDVDHFSGFYVNQHRAITLAFSESKIIDASYPKSKLIDNYRPFFKSLQIVDLPTRTTFFRRYFSAEMELILLERVMISSINRFVFLDFGRIKVKGTAKVR